MRSGDLNAIWSRSRVFTACDVLALRGRRSAIRPGFRLCAGVLITFTLTGLSSAVTAGLSLEELPEQLA